MSIVAKILLAVGMFILALFLTILIFLAFSIVNALNEYLSNPLNHKEENLRFWRCGLCGESFRFKELQDISNHLKSEHPDNLETGIHRISESDKCMGFNVYPTYDSIRQYTK